MEREDDVGKWTDYNRQFHAAFAARIPSPRLIAILSRLRDSAAPYVGLALTAHEHRAGANADHRLMLEALHARDGTHLAQIAERHLDLTIAALERSRDLRRVECCVPQRYPRNATFCPESLPLVPSREEGSHPAQRSIALLVGLGVQAVPAEARPDGGESIASPTQGRSR